MEKMLRELMEWKEYVSLLRKALDGLLQNIDIW